MRASGSASFVPLLPHQETCSCVRANDNITWGDRGCTSICYHTLYSYVTYLRRSFFNKRLVAPTLQYHTVAHKLTYNNTTTNVHLITCNASPSVALTH